MRDEVTLYCRSHKHTPAEISVESGRDQALCPVCGKRKDRQTAVNDAAQYFAAQEAHDMLSDVARRNRRQRSSADDLFSIEITYDDREFRRLREPDFIFR